jgi:hypothetical protein
VKAEEGTSLASTSVSADSSSEISESSSSATSSDKLEDSDGNGIPDVIEDYYAKHIQEQYMFGISLGSLIGLATSIIGWLFMFFKNNGQNKRANSWMTEQSSKNDAVISNYSSILDKTNDEIKKQTELIESQRIILDEVNERNDKLMDRLEEDEKKLAALSKSSYKIDAILDNTVLLAKTSELVKNGAAQKVEENSKEAK